MTDADKSTAFQCPYEECERVEAFKTRKNLLRHFTIHVQCREICAFCERIFTHARPYIAHKCKARDPNNEPKNIYTSRRYEELRRRASKELDRILANDESLSQSLRDQVKRRPRVADDSLEVSRAPKRAKTTFGDVNEVTNEAVPVVEPPGEIYTFLQPPRNIDETIATNGDLNSHFSAPLFYHPVGGLTNGDFDSNFSAPLFYETMGGSTGASDEIFHAPVFEGLAPASNSTTALQFHAEFITQQQALLKDGGWT
ncbi:hypothetical protein DL95DRAFT_94846 [Leptodontidium sp. 2 PMI_412]|nr:hypothetical protein DL95DRAFT_94846 [Leptodontidium sp. 2 PMI_412]